MYLFYTWSSFEPIGNYEKTLELQISLREVLPADHLARFIVDVVAELDLSNI